jgi:hypothetical protein
MTALGKRLEVASGPAAEIEYHEGRAEEFWEGTRDHDVSQNIAALLRFIESEPPVVVFRGRRFFPGLVDTVSQIAPASSGQGTKGPSSGWPLSPSPPSRRGKPETGKGLVKV